MPSTSIDSVVTDLLRAFMDHSPAVAWMKDAEGRHVYISKPYIEMIGIPCDDWHGKTDFDLWPRQVAERFRELDKQVLETGESVQFEDQENITFHGGRLRTWWITKFPLRSGNAEYVGGIAVDITAQKQTEKALRYQHMVSERLIDTSHNIVLVLDNEQRIVRFNPFFERLSGWRIDEVRGREFAKVFLPDEGRAELRKRFENAIHSEHSRGHTLSILTKSKDALVVEWYNSRLSDASGDRDGLLCIGVDNTQRRSLEAQIERITEREQRRIGQELHDSIGQELTALRIFSEHLAEQLESIETRDPSACDDVGPLKSLASKISDGLRTASQNVQTLSRSMAATSIGTETLQSLLSNMATTTDSLPGLSCTFRFNESSYEVNNIVAQHLYRIAQEAVNNAIKHSSASRIDLRLTLKKSEILLEVRDNGTGFDAADAPAENDQSQGIGLQVMRYRADLIGADIAITESEQGGTSVKCSLRKH